MKRRYTKEEVHKQSVANHLVVCHRNGESISECEICQSFRGGVRAELERVVNNTNELAALLTDARQRHDGNSRPPARKVADFKQQLQVMMGGSGITGAKPAHPALVRKPGDYGYLPPKKKI